MRRGSWLEWVKWAGWRVRGEIKDDRWEGEKGMWGAFF